jgi:hypothetical protein
VPRCPDGVKNGAETDVDCGGAQCPKCASGKTCAQASDCTSGVCNVTCRAPACDDTVKNGTETDVDCGGACVKCANGKLCVLGSDCQSGVCNVTCRAPTCSDGVKNGGESGVDCGGPPPPGGGSACQRCPPGQSCTAPSDCQSGVCSGQICQGASCNDSTKNGGESDVDCGGQTSCNRCNIGQTCTVNGDCTTGFCSNGVCSQTCGNGVKDGTETDVDCGGPACPRCNDGRSCAVANDCLANNCQSGICCKAGVDGDGDSLLDCAEYTDATTWTNATVFNGLAGTLVQPCSAYRGAVACSDQDRVDSIRQCGAAPAFDQLNQYSGWSWPTSDEVDPCGSTHGFAPNWTKCGATDWGVYYTGYFATPNAGTYCFAVNSAALQVGGTACGSILVNGDTAPQVATQETGSVCVSAAGGSGSQSIPIELHYQQMIPDVIPIPLPGGIYGFEIVWCYSNSGNECNPNTSTALHMGPNVLRISP